MMTKWAEDPSRLEYFADLPNPRIERCKEHYLIDIIAIAILAAICGEIHFTEIGEFGIVKSKWLKTFLKLLNGIPSLDTFARVFARLNPAEFHEWFVLWGQAIAEITSRDIIAIDATTACPSHNRSAGKVPLQLVSA